MSPRPARKSVAKRPSSPGPAVVRVGLLGLGNVGAGVAELLSRHHRLIAERSGVDLRLVRAFVRHPRKQRPGAAGRVPLTTDPEAVYGAADVDVVCELLGGLSPAYELISAALARGRTVVTANKAVLALHGPRLLDLAAESGAELHFEAAVAGGLPIIRTLREGLAGDRVDRVMGILNGTTNFILGRMERGEPYAAALAEAQARGFAEADPTLDVTGRDAADKLAILMQLAFGLSVRPDAILTDGITSLTPEILADARELGFRVKLLAIGGRAPGGEGVVASVQPTFVPLGHALSTVSGADNAVAIVSDALGLTLYQGKGAGGEPTGTAVVSDLIDAARGLRAGLRRRGAWQSRAGLRIAPAATIRRAFYLRLLVADRPGVLAAVTQVLARYGVSLATVLQRERAGAAGGRVPVVMVTHETTQGAMQRAVRDLERLKALRGHVQLIGILEEAP
jgi:homoserine dehydrogenase